MGGAVRGFLRRHVTLMGSVVAVETTEPIVVMTFDDGPEPGQTERVLDALDAHGASATFFMLSRRAVAERALVREVVERGHEIALHGHDHRPLNGFGAAEVHRRTASARAELEDVAGVAVRWMRPPYGRQSPRTYRAIRRAGLVPVLWGASNRDSAADDTATRLDAAMRVDAGTILLCHDGRAGNEDGANDPPIPPFDRGDLTRRVLDAYAQRGLRGVSLEHGLQVGRARHRAWFG